jgi:hypothetical protein
VVREALSVTCVSCCITVELTPCESLPATAAAFCVRHESCLTSVDLTAYRRLLTLTSA